MYICFIVTRLWQNRPPCLCIFVIFIQKRNMFVYIWICSGACGRIYLLVTCFSDVGTAQDSVRQGKAMDKVVMLR